MVHQCNRKYIYWQLFLCSSNFSWAVVRTFVAMGCTKPMLVELSYKFPKEMKDSRLLSVCDRLLSLLNARQPTNSLNLLSKSNLLTTKPACAAGASLIGLSHKIINAAHSEVSSSPFACNSKVADPFPQLLINEHSYKPTSFGSTPAITRVGVSTPASVVPLRVHLTLMSVSSFP